MTEEPLRPAAQRVADALRNMAVVEDKTVETVRIWGRLTSDAHKGPAGNAWAGSPEDVAAHLDALGLLPADGVDDGVG